MNKSRVNKRIESAYVALKETGIATLEEKDNLYHISKTYRGQISSFGAAVVMGSLKSAVAFFSAKGGSDTERPALLRAMYYVMKNELVDADNVSKIFRYVCENDTPETKEDFIDAAIAVKLAMNLYTLD